MKRSYYRHLEVSCHPGVKIVTTVKILLEPKLFFIKKFAGVTLVLLD